MFQKAAWYRHLLPYDLSGLGIAHGISNVVCPACSGYGIIYNEVDNIVVANLILLRKHPVVGMQPQVAYVNTAFHLFTFLLP